MEQYLAADPQAPVVCDMTTAPDTGDQRMAEYGRLFEQHLAGRERTTDGIRFRFRGDDDVQAWIQDLAAREHACCPFFSSRITRVGAEIHWDSRVIDDDVARAVLDEFYRLPETFTEGLDGLEHRLNAHGLKVLLPDA
jgi:hypothetical protein